MSSTTAGRSINATRYMINERFSRPTAPRDIRNAIQPAFDNGNNSVAGYPPELMTIGRERRERETDNTFAINQTDFIGKFNTGMFEHTFAAGVEVSRETRDQSRFDICDPGNIACRTSVFYPDSNGSPTGGTPIVAWQRPDAGAQLRRLCVRSGQAQRVFRVARIVALRPVLDGLHGSRPGARRQPVSVAHRRHVELPRRRGVPSDARTRASMCAYGNSYNPSAELGTLASRQRRQRSAPEQNQDLRSRRQGRRAAATSCR